MARIVRYRGADFRVEVTNLGGIAVHSSKDMPSFANHIYPSMLEEMLGLVFPVWTLRRRIKRALDAMLVASREEVLLDAALAGLGED